MLSVDDFVIKESPISVFERSFPIAHLLLIDPDGFVQIPDNNSQMKHSSKLHTIHSPLFFSLTDFSDTHSQEPHILPDRHPEQMQADNTPSH